MIVLKFVLKKLSLKCLILVLFVSAFLVFFVCEVHKQVAQLKMCIDRAKFIKDQAILMIQELENSDD
jgi:hypothetical protein